MYSPPHLLNIDLCILSYQLYHQSVIWPLDPWYEMLARKLSSRRDNFMAAVHDWAGTLDPQDDYSGPAAAKGWGESNMALDPVITNYRQINPRLPAFSRDDTNFLAALTPSYITGNIKVVELAKYRTRPSATPMMTEVEIVEVCDYPDGTDHLIAFEAGTGIIESGHPAWSIMGYVLMRQRPNSQEHDIHIVFRGSRSGSAVRAAVQALGNKGNPDWVTDIDFVNQVQENWISKAGNVCRGFAQAVKTALGTITASLTKLDQLYGKPENIWITGHSLGAALAVQFASSAVMGSYGDFLRQGGGIAKWPWDNLNCVVYALPVAGSKEWSDLFDLLVNCRFIWVDGDSVVTGGSGKVAKVMTISAHHVGQGVKLVKPTGTSENPHEPHLIRAAVLREAQKIRPLDVALKNETPWAYYKSFALMLAGAAFSYRDPMAKNPTMVSEKNIRSVLNLYHFGIEFEQFLNVFKEIIIDKSSYKKPNFMISKSKLERRKARLELVIRGMNNVQGNKPQILDDLVLQITALEGVQGSNTDLYLGLGLILNTYQRTNLTLDEIKQRPKLKACLEANTPWRLV